MASGFEHTPECLHVPSLTVALENRVTFEEGNVIQLSHLLVRNQVPVAHRLASQFLTVRATYPQNRDVSLATDRHSAFTSTHCASHPRGIDARTSPCGDTVRAKRPAIAASMMAGAKRAIRNNSFTDTRIGPSRCAIFPAPDTTPDSIKCSLAGQLVLTAQALGTLLKDLNR